MLRLLPAAFLRVRALCVQPSRLAAPFPLPLLQASSLRMPSPPPNALRARQPFGTSAARVRELKRIGKWSWLEESGPKWRLAVETTIAEVPLELHDLIEVEASAPHISHKDPKEKGSKIARVTFWQDRSAVGKKPKKHVVHVNENGKWSGKWQEAWKEKKKSKKN